MSENVRGGPSHQHWTPVFFESGFAFDGSIDMSLNNDVNVDTEAIKVEDGRK